MRTNFESFIDITDQLAAKNGEMLVNLLSERDDMDIHPIDFVNSPVAMSIYTARRNFAQTRNFVAYHKDIYQMESKQL